jgi:hypothetical protein
MIGLRIRNPEAENHIYKVGETVGWSAPAYVGRPTMVEIMRCLPPLGKDLQYRIKSIGGVHENVAIEGDLTRVKREAKAAPAFLSSSLSPPLS